MNPTRRRPDAPPPGWASEARRDVLHYLFRLFARAPAWVSRAHVSALALTLRAVGPVPGNPVRGSCASIARIAPAAGHDPGALYRRFVEQVRAAALGYLGVVRDGPPAVATHVAPLADPTPVTAALEAGRGVLLAVPHNVGGILAGVQFAREFPTRLLMRNSTSVARDRTILEIFRRLEVDAYFTRGESPTGLFRASLGALRAGRVLVATLDNIDPGRKSRIDVPFLGADVPFASWGARIAVQARAPVLPAWVTFADGRFRMEFGEPLADASVEATMRHYAAYFERRILEDPASWLFLGHKRWKRVLGEAERGIVATP